MRNAIRECSVTSASTVCCGVSAFVACTCSRNASPSIGCAAIFLISCIERHQENEKCSDFLQVFSSQHSVFSPRSCWAEETVQRGHGQTKSKVAKQDMGLFWSEEDLRKCQLG